MLVRCVDDIDEILKGYVFQERPKQKAVWQRPFQRPFKRPFVQERRPFQEKDDGVFGVAANLWFP